MNSTPPARTTASASSAPPSARPFTPRPTPCRPPLPTRRWPYRRTRRQRPPRLTTLHVRGHAAGGWRRPASPPTTCCRSGRHARAVKASSAGVWARRAAHDDDLITILGGVRRPSMFVPTSQARSTPRAAALRADAQQPPAGQFLRRQVDRWAAHSTAATASTRRRRRAVRRRRRARAAPSAHWPARAARRRRTYGLQLRRRSPSCATRSTASSRPLSALREPINNCTKTGTGAASARTRCRCCAGSPTCSTCQRCGSCRSPLPHAVVLPRRHRLGPHHDVGQLGRGTTTSPPLPCAHATRRAWRRAAVRLRAVPSKGDGDVNASGLGEQKVAVRALIGGARRLRLRAGLGVSANGLRFATR